MSVNITLLVHNRPRLTAQTLASLAGIPDTTVTIYGDAPDVDTAEICRQWAKQSDDRRFYMDTRSVGTGHARNLVIKFSEATFGRGEYLYLSDSDISGLREDWLRVLVDCYEASWSDACRVLGAVGHPYHQKGDTLGACSFDARYAVKQVLAQPLQSMLMKWNVWDFFGPFEVTPVGRVCAGEDVSFSQKINAMHLKLGVVDPPLLVNCGITNSFGEKIPGWEMVKAEAPAGVIVE